MNEKFYDLSEEKQSQILNAAYKVFATNQYKKAPTSEIAAEAGISKSLLFHYFHNKLELYLFLWKHAADLTRKYMCEYKVYETDDFFEILRRGLMAKCAVMRKYTFYLCFPLIHTLKQSRIFNHSSNQMYRMLPKRQWNYFCQF